MMTVTVNQNVFEVLSTPAVDICFHQKAQPAHRRILGFKLPKLELTALLELPWSSTNSTVTRK